MRGSIDDVTKLLSRWSRQQETALLQMSSRKTAGQRVGGFTKSERADAKFLVLAFAPIVPLALSDQLRSWLGVFQWVWLALGIVWCAFVMAICFAAYWRAIRQSARRKP